MEAGAAGAVGWTTALWQPEAAVLGVGQRRKASGCEAEMGSRSSMRARGGVRAAGEAVKEPEKPEGKRYGAGGGDARRGLEEKGQRMRGRDGQPELDAGGRRGRSGRRGGEGAGEAGGAALWSRRRRRSVRDRGERQADERLRWAAGARCEREEGPERQERQ
ncbi:hypothetical protein GUJ93_ZPchr0001g29964 [Zizania palustris]|uniref:Uncharacterized protein n=1 Tax=Zizania palustris TaxID=103762 RepID=A0A8J5RTE8_ZIZPA|nr:hypothetical protein GUJ93_ZPchr0001g29964 [Zizania palustris]